MKFKNLFPIVLCTLTLITVCLIYGSNRVQAAALAQLTITPSTVKSGENANYLLNLKTSGAIPANGKITILFPSGFDISSASFGGWTGIDGGALLSINMQTITIDRDGSGTSSTSGVKTITINNVINTNTVGSQYQVVVSTLTNTSSIIDGSTSSIYFQIFDSHNETSVGGIYYLRGVNQTHYQYENGIGTIYDIGTLSKTAPTTDEFRYCGVWTQYYFDDNGTYTQTNQISNIYYHVWWNTTSMQATMGYDTAGGYDANFDESFALSTANTPNKSNGYRLYAGNQTFASPKNIVGNNIYNFGVKLLKNLSNPQIISTPNYTSFIILNLPENIDTLGLSQDGDTDQDNDGLNDYAELFTYSTNPYVNDTDGDSMTDSQEIAAGRNPLDKNVAPIFRNLTIRYKGEYADSGLGSAITTIEDLDGDGKREIITGAQWADAQSLNNSGNVTIISSGTGEVIRQFNGLTANSFFGKSVDVIEDLDGDGKQDVIIGAKYGPTFFGAVYIYSSGTGALIRVFYGPEMFSSFGSSVKSINDQDGDGKEDIVVGAPDASGYFGSAYIYSSGTGTMIRQWNGSSSYSAFGQSVAILNDRNNDGKEDIAISAPYNNSNRGAVFVYSSSTGTLLDQFEGATTADALGTGLSPIKDLDGDGKDELVIASYLAPYGGYDNAGVVTIYSSDTGLPLHSFHGSLNGDFFGTSISTINDIDNDGVDDLIIGSTCHDANQKVCSGSVYIYSTLSGNLLRQFSGEYTNDRLGVAVAALNDIDGDGKVDLVAATSGFDDGNKYDVGAIYIFSSQVNGIPNQSWTQGASRQSAIDLDHYFFDPNIDSLPTLGESITYSASTTNNPYVDVLINNPSWRASFFSPAEWAGQNKVTFTATDSTNMSSVSSEINLVVPGTAYLNVPTIGVPQVLSSSAIKWIWTDTSEIEGSYSIEYVNNGNFTTSNKFNLFPQSERSTAGNVYSWTAEGLASNTTYSIRVRAYNALTGESGPSLTATATTANAGSSTCQLLNRPEIYKIAIEGTQSARLYFSSDNPSATSYSIVYGTSSGSSEFNLQNLVINSNDRLNYVISSLKPKSRYFFRIRAHSSCAISDWSNEVQVVTSPVLRNIDSTLSYPDDSLVSYATLTPSEATGNKISNEVLIVGGLVLIITFGTIFYFKLKR